MVIFGEIYSNRGEVNYQRTTKSIRESWAVDGMSVAGQCL